MPDKNPTARSSHHTEEPRGVCTLNAQLLGEPSAEEAAAIVAVLSLMQAEPHPGTEAPSASAWARAGRREAIRPWARQE